MQAEQIDLFCQVVDHLGDAGTAWRLSRELRGKRGDGARIRLFIDKIDPLIPLIETLPGAPAIELVEWSKLEAWLEAGHRPAPVVIELFGCTLPEAYSQHLPGHSRLIINLDYFSCEPWTLSYHKKESLIEVAGARKFFFMPGLDWESGGILVESRKRIDAVEVEALRSSWLSRLGLDIGWSRFKWLPVYSYQGSFTPMLDELEKRGEPWLIWLMGESAQSRILRETPTWSRVEGGGFFPLLRRGRVTLAFPPLLDQVTFDTLLALADLSLVRGEDSMAGALLSGRFFLWQLYPQEKDIHRVKLEALIEQLSPIWRDDATAQLFARSQRAFNFPEKEGEVPWGAVMDSLPVLGEALDAYARQLSETCNLSQNLLDFILFFFKE